MQNWIDSIFRNFERILRWIYPGALFLSLLYLSSPNCLNFIKEVEAVHSWLLLLFAVIAGCIIYLSQQVITQLFSLLITGSRWEWEPDHEKLHWGCCRYIARCFFDPWADLTISRFKPQKHLDSWLNLAWARYHATFITAWLILIFFFFKSSQSILSLIQPWIVFFFVAILLFGSILQFLWLTRITIRFWQ